MDLSYLQNLNFFSYMIDSQTIVKYALLGMILAPLVFLEKQPGMDRILASLGFCLIGLFAFDGYQYVDYRADYQYCATQPLDELSAVEFTNRCINEHHAKDTSNVTTTEKEFENVVNARIDTDLNVMPYNIALIKTVKETSKYEIFDDYSQIDQAMDKRIAVVRQGMREFNSLDVTSKFSVSVIDKERVAQQHETIEKVSLEAYLHCYQVNNPNACNSYTRNYEEYLEQYNAYQKAVRKLKA